MSQVLGLDKYACDTCNEATVAGPVLRRQPDHSGWVIFMPTATAIPNRHMCPDCRPTPSRAEKVAAEFHAAYEGLASGYGYKTREESAVPWAEVPEKNRKLMIATVQRLLDLNVIRVS
jgi:hypothetical protein